MIVDAPDERTPSKKRQAKCPLKRATGGRVGKLIEGARQKSNGKWSDSRIFPGREFDNLDAYRAAKKQRAARREEYRAQIPDSSYQKAYKERRAAYDQARTNPCAH